MPSEYDEVGEFTEEPLIDAEERLRSLTEELEAERRGEFAL